MSGQVTIEQALRILGAAKEFHDADSGFANGCIALIRSSVPLNAEKRARAYRMLERYSDRLDHHGIPHSSIIPPDNVPPKMPPGKPLGVVAPPPNANVGHSRLYLDIRGRLVAKTPYALRDTISSAGGRYAGKGTGLYLFPATPTAAEKLVELLSPTGVDFDEGVKHLLEKAAHIHDAAQFKSAESLPPIPISKTDAWLHQRQAFWFAKDLAAVMLDMEMGTGKSKVNCDLVVNSGAMSTLIVCPDRVVGVWPKQFGIHAGRECHVIDPRHENKNGRWVYPSVKDRVALYDQALHECGCGLPHVILTNYAAAAHEPFKSWAAHERWDMVIYDEVHKLKSAGGVWSKWAHRLVNVSGQRVGATGTLMPQTPLDVYGQFRALDPGIFGTNEAVFNRRYAKTKPVKTKAGPNQRIVDQIVGVNPDTEDELAEKISIITYRVGAEVLDLPDQVPPVMVTAQLGPQAWKVYQDLEDEMFAAVLLNVGDGMQVEDAITAPNALVKVLRLMQLTGGALHLDSGEMVEVDDNKRRLMREDLEDIPSVEPVVCFARFHHDLDSIRWAASELNRPYHELSGRQDDALTRDATLAPDVVIAGVQIQSGGTGIDFTRSCIASYFSVGHSLSDFQQSKARLRRPGQTRPVRFRHLVMEGTIDEDVYEALANNERITQRIGEKIMERQRRRAAS